MAKIMIIGAGIVGQANGSGLLSKGHDVIFIDKNPDLVKNLNQRSFTAYQPQPMSQYTDFDADISFFCVPTPYKRNENYVGQNGSDGHVDIFNITEAITSHAKWITSTIKNRNKQKRNRTRHLVVIRSTVPPGTTRSILLPLLESHSGMKVGKEIGLCMHPEFLRTATSESDFLNPRTTIIGEFDETSGNILERLYSNFGGEILRADLETAEFMKYVHNCFNATKISFANEMWEVGQKLGIDANLALQMAAKSAEGFWNPNYGTKGGSPYDGRCLPKDIKGFLSFVRKFGYNMSLMSAVDSVNSRMKEELQNNNKDTRRQLTNIGTNASKKNPVVTQRMVNYQLQDYGRSNNNSYDGTNNNINNHNNRQKRLSS